MKFELETWLSRCAGEVERWLTACVDHFDEDANVPSDLLSAMGYSLLGGGKRLRPALCIASAHACDDAGAGEPGQRPNLLRDACCAIELVHNYSLIHDDLPAMDDDDLRRGRPTCHRVHGEAMAILAGDGLLTDAFAVLAGGLAPGGAVTNEEASARLRLLSRLARAAGSGGMVGGQALDIARTAVGRGLDEVETVHRLKTGALFSFCCAAGAESVGASAKEVELLARFGEDVGLAFQIADDILDETGDAGRVGKRVRKDLARNAATVTRAIGTDAARDRADALIAEALGSISSLGDGASALRALSSRLVKRAS